MCSSSNIYIRRILLNIQLYVYALCLVNTLAPVKKGVSLILKIKIYVSTEIESIADEPRSR